MPKCVFFCICFLHNGPVLLCRASEKETKQMYDGGAFAVRTIVTNGGHRSIAVIFCLTEDSNDSNWNSLVSRLVQLHWNTSRYY